jgi:hypothetical protein
MRRAIHRAGGHFSVRYRERSLKAAPARSIARHISNNEAADFERFYFGFPNHYAANYQASDSQSSNSECAYGDGSDRKTDQGRTAQANVF